MKNNYILDILTKDELREFKENLCNELMSIDIMFDLDFTLDGSKFILSVTYNGPQFNPLLHESYSNARFENAGLGKAMLVTLEKTERIANIRYSYVNNKINCVTAAIDLRYSGESCGTLATKYDPSLFGWLSDSSAKDDILRKCLDDIRFGELRMFLSEYLHNVVLYSEEAKTALIPFFSFNLTTESKEEFITNIHKGKYICNTTKELSLIVEEWFKELGIEGYIINVTN